MVGLPDLVDSVLTCDGRIATLVMNREDVRNELTGTRLHAEIVEVVDWINANDQISVLILTGTGKAFSAGGNVKHMRERSGNFEGDVYRLQNNYRRGIQRMALAMRRLEIPSIAAINGPAIGAGLDLACMCDVRLAQEGAMLGETFVNLGIIPGDGGAWFLQRLIGYQRAAELTFSGRLVDAEEAKKLGLVLEVVAPNELMEKARAMAEQFAAKPPQALRLSKRLLVSAGRSELQDFLDLCAVFQGMSHHTTDHLEAVSAFLEKRAPKFSGS